MPMGMGSLYWGYRNRRLQLLRWFVTKLASGSLLGSQMLKKFNGGSNAKNLITKYDKKESLARFRNYVYRLFLLGCD